jgi:methionine-rich copper-binding protein CopC
VTVVDDYARRDVVTMCLTPRERFAVLIVALAALVVPSGPAAAHTELDFTLPAEGTTVGTPLAEISVGFTEPVTLVGNGFEVLDPQGNVLQPFAVTDDDMVFRLQLDPPLAGGPVGVRYEVTSQDGHVIDGSFTFTVAAEAPPPTTASTAPPTTAPATAPASTTTIVNSSLASTTVATTAISAESAPVTSVIGTDASSDDDSDRTLLAVVLLVVALASAGFLFVRSRTKR